MKKTIFSLLLSIAVFFSFVVQAAKQETLSKNVIRLHVIANSDNEADQAVKLLVRDAILEAFSDYTENESKVSAEDKIRKDLPIAEGVANRVLKENGFSYLARAEYGVYDFPLRIYGDVTLPAGRYSGLRIHLGSGAGQNWWCVMYPPLCLNELNTTASENGSDAVTFEFKFKFLQFLQSL